MLFDRRNTKAARRFLAKATGAKVSQPQVNGPRYIWQVTVDANTQTGFGGKAPLRPASLGRLSRHHLAPRSW